MMSRDRNGDQRRQQNRGARDYTRVHESSQNRTKRQIRPGLDFLPENQTRSGFSYALFENIGHGRGEVVLRLLPALLEVLLPVLRPRTAIVIDETRVRRGGLLGTAIGVVDVA